jgi:hypothetical protein
VIDRPTPRQDAERIAISLALGMPSDARIILIDAELGVMRTLLARLVGNEDVYWKLVAEELLK